MYEWFDTQLSRQHREDMLRKVETARLEEELRRSQRRDRAWLWELHRHLGNARKLLRHFV